MMIVMISVCVFGFDFFFFKTERFVFGSTHFWNSIEHTVDCVFVRACVLLSLSRSCVSSNRIHNNGKKLMTISV